MTSIAVALFIGFIVGQFAMLLLLAFLKRTDDLFPEGEIHD